MSLVLTAEEQHRIHMILVRKIIILEDAGADEQAKELGDATIAFLSTVRIARQCKGGIHGKPT